VAGSGVYVSGRVPDRASWAAFAAPDGASGGQVTVGIPTVINCHK
jgi:hypothetical protein